MNVQTMPLKNSHIPLSVDEVHSWWPELRKTGVRVFVDVAPSLPAPHAEPFVGAPADHRIRQGDLLVRFPSVEEAAGWLPSGAVLVPVMWGRFRVTLGPGPAAS